ncbi:MAG TPA: ECF transporter S component [Clostridia bacterium]
MNFSTQKLTRMGLLCAISVVLILIIKISFIPSATYLVYEPGDVPILLGSFMFGPIAGFIMTVVVALIQTATSGKDGLIGCLMHIIATGTLAIVAGFIYKHLRNTYGAIAALTLGSISMILIMIPSNLFFTVRFYNVPYDVVKASIPTIYIPFNAIKSGINSLLAFLLYMSLNRYLDFDGKRKSKNNSQINFK